MRRNLGDLSAVLTTAILLIVFFYVIPAYSEVDSYIHYDPTTDPAICGHRISDIHYDNLNNRVLVATGYFWSPRVISDWRLKSEQASSGICILNKVTNVVTTYNKSNSLFPTDCYKSITFGDNMIIAGSYYSGIIIFNEITGQLTVYNKDTTPALKVGEYSHDTAPISDLHYENGRIYFAYGEFTQRGICGGVIDLANNTIMHYYYGFSPVSGPYTFREPSSLLITEDRIYFADRWITVFNKINGQILHNREDNADTNDWGPDQRSIAYDSVYDRLYVGDTSGWRFTDNLGLRIYDGQLNYLGHWDSDPVSHPTPMLANNVDSLKIDNINRRLYIAHHIPGDLPNVSPNLGYLQIVDLDKMEVIKNYVPANENRYDYWSPDPIKLLPEGRLEASYSWTNVITSIEIDGNGNIYLGQTCTHRQSAGDGGGLGIIAAIDKDTDSDGILNISDNCPDTPNPDQSNADGDTQGDSCDDDDDNDGVTDGEDNCPLVVNAEQIDTDSDGTGDVCDEDLDGDTVLNGADNCPVDPNTEQTDTDGDGEGDECDTNDDNDEVPDVDDNCPTVTNNDQADLDGDNIGDDCDIDIDGDGIENANDNCPLTLNNGQDDTDFDQAGDACDEDDDNDTILDVNDNCSLVANPSQADVDDDGKGDVCDGDLDGDGVDNSIDNCLTVANSSQNDLDGDGLGDACDPDIDEDGLLNGGDLCADTLIGAIVDPGTGCSIDQLCPCEGPMGTSVSWRNHGKYTSCVAKSAESFVDFGLITEIEKDAMVSEAAQSNCGVKK